MIVQEEQTRSRIAGHQNIWPAILVKISRYHGKAVGASKACNAGFLANIGEGAITVVAIERVITCPQSARTAINGNALVAARRVGGGGHRRVIKIKLHIVGDEQIQKSIAVVVQETAPRPEAPVVAQQT